MKGLPDGESPFFRTQTRTAMFKHLFFATAALFTVGTASAWKIEGRIAGVADKDSVSVMLFRYWGNIGRSIQTDTVRNGRFSFSDTLPAGEMVMMSIRAGNGRTTSNLWITDTTEIRIGGAADSDWIVTSNEPEQAIERELRAVGLSDLDSLLETDEGYWKHRDSVWRIHVERLWPVFDQYPNSQAMLNCLNFYVKVGAVPHDKLQRIYDRLTPEMRGTLNGEAIAVALDPPRIPQVGEPFGDFQAADTSGATHRLSDFAGRGKYVLLDFWSVGCGGCYAAFPELKEIYARYKDRLEIVGVSLDANREMWQGAIIWQALPWVHLSDGKGTYAGAGVLYKPDVMPTYVLIDPQGTIVERWYPGEGDFRSRMIEPYLEKQ